MPQKIYIYIYIYIYTHTHTHTCINTHTQLININSQNKVLVVGDYLHLTPKKGRISDRK